MTDLVKAQQLAFLELDSAQPISNGELKDDASFPEQFANELSQIETYNKHLFRPNTYLHKWWARRCGSTFRVILKHFVNDPLRRDYYAPGGLEGKIVLDPMMGGGTTLHEAIRLGASVIGADIDPIPVAQARATLTEVSLTDLRSAFTQFFNDLYEKIGYYFQTECPICARTLDTQYTLHGLRKTCGCGEVVQIDQYELRHEAERVIRIWPETWEIGAQPPSSINQAKSPRLITKAETVCPVCTQKYRELLDIPFYARYTPVAVVGECPVDGLFFHPASRSDWIRIHTANAQRNRLDFGALDNFIVSDGPKTGDLLSRNVHSYMDVFSARQLMYLYHAIQLLQKYNGAIKLNLSLLVSTSLEFNAMLCGYKGWFKRRPGAIRHVFGLHAYAFQYTALENNPINRYKSSGNLQQLFHDRIVRGRRWASAPIERKVTRNGQTQAVRIQGETDSSIEVHQQADLMNKRQAFWLIQGDSSKLPVADQSVDLVVTDPPYYDSVQYSDLAAFFRVWLSRLLPAEINWTYDVTNSAVSANGANGAHFASVMSGIFNECARVLKPGAGRLVFTFHHWNPNAWAELTSALGQAQFKLLNVYVVLSEHPISVHIANVKSIKHDAILMLASNQTEPATLWQQPNQIDTSDSEQFCRQCGQALGWLLEKQYSPTDVLNIWKNLICKRG